MNIDTNTFIAACCGRNESGKSKSGISCSLLTFCGGASDANSPEAYKEISSRFTKEAELKLTRLNEFIQVSLIYRSSFDPELRTFWNQLETYGDALEDFNKGNTTAFPILAFNVSPEEYADKGFLAFSAPLFWVLQPDYVGEDKCNVIRMLFKEDTFFIEDVPDDIDLTTEEAIAERTYNVIRTEK